MAEARPMIEQLVRHLGVAAAPRAVSLMERAPQFLIYMLHVPYALYLILRYRGITLPTVANPGLDGGGLTKESKAALYELLGPVGRALHAPFVTLLAGSTPPEIAKERMTTAGLTFPVVVKPDIGRRGFGVKTVRTDSELATHLAKFPAGVSLLIQRYAPGPGEAGLFYLRWPTEERGHVLSLTIKHFPEVTGDGRSTLRQLILRDRRARAFARVYFKRNAARLDQVIPHGQRQRLVSVGNHVRGASFEDGSHLITPALEQLFDTIARELPGFHVGRFDVRYPSLDSLMRGEDLTLIEYNGAGGEPTHIWDPNTSVAKTYAGLLAHLRYVYAVGAENRNRGANPLSVRELARRYLDELRLLRGYPDEE